MTSQRKFSHVLCSAAASVLALTLSNPSMAADYAGASVKIGNGEAHTFVRTDSKDSPTTIGIAFTSGMLDGLPQPTPGSAPDVPYTLPMPSSGPKTIVDHVVINWEPHGHPPPKIYDAPHFDFHFYLVSEAEHNSVTFADDKASADPAQQPPADLLAAGYVVPPGTAVPKMGVHAINTSAQEFKGSPFTATFIYGYFNKKLTFLEPMASVSFLKSKPTYVVDIPRPKKYSFAGAYPAAYSVRYDAGKDSYEVNLESFR